MSAYICTDLKPEHSNLLRCGYI